MAKISMDVIVNHAKTRGFIYSGSEIYGGLSNSWDYGPLGSELKNNIKSAWWKRFVHNRLDMVGIDAALIMNPRVWEASGHINGFTDPLVECKVCHERYRADHIDIKKPCPKCGAKDEFTEPAQFNLMFKTFIGAKEDATNIAYFRPETAQAMFVDFPQILRSTRKRIPFGVAQIGKAFRNEITPGNFIFRTREFEQMEIEYFIHESNWEKHFNAWHKEMYAWLEECGVKRDMLHDYEQKGNELAHYSKRTVDIEFDFPFGRDELYGLAYRTDHDLRAHQKASNTDMTFTDPNTQEKYVPHVIEPTFGVDRTLLALFISAYTVEDIPTADGGIDKRLVMKFPKHLAPVKIAVLPLSKKEELQSIALPIAEKLTKKWNTDYDFTQSIGKRYRRQDEIGTPFCVTVDFDSIDDHAVTVRDRDTMKQERIAIGELEDYFEKKFS